MQLSKGGIYKKFIKRPKDLILSLVALIVLSPLLIVIAIMIKGDSKGPILFTQERIGKNNLKFTIYKFRTMVNNADRIGSGLKTSQNDMRITKIGNILRKTSLDEIPQLLNIVKGDMSIIGPRPTVEKVVDQLPEKDLKRHAVRPGVTGLAQVNGRQSLNWSEKIKYDLKYVNQISFKLDLKILFMTIFVVLKKEGVHKKEVSNEYKNL